MTYEDALAEAEKAGANHAGDTALLAMFCAYNVQTLVGAVSPQLVFEGAQKQGLTVTDLTGLCANDPAAVHALMW